MANLRRLLFVFIAFWSAGAWAQTTVNESSIGYIYPAGGQVGSEVVIMVGGQVLRGASDVYVSGEGVSAAVVEYVRPPRNLDKDQRTLIQDRLKEVRSWRLAELEAQGVKVSSTNTPAGGKVRANNAAGKNVQAKTGATKKASATENAKVELPPHPLLHDLNNKSLRELAHVASMVFMPRTKLQMNRQISEAVLVKVSIDRDAEPGRRELRIRTATGLTNPMVFQVGLLSEVRELEPNDQEAYPPLPGINVARLPEDKPVDLPATFNGQIMPGDVDRFRFSARQGQNLVIQAHARSLIPYLADAVPGWFQATVALYDSKGNEIAFADDYRFDPDPVLFYKVPKSGEYELEIHDSIYRGREDFVYRVSVGEQPFVTQTFPLGGRSGDKVVASVDGWNLLTNQLTLDTEGQTGIRHTAYRKDMRLSNSVCYAVDELPECEEAKSNDTRSQAQEVELPRIINGRIENIGDVDVFRFKASAGEKVVAEVCARCLNSPMDSLLRLMDSSGKIIEWNDDHEIQKEHLYKDMVGLVTHHADSYLTAELSAEGTYYVQVSDAQNHGGDAYGYRLRISKPQPDFALRVTPSSLSTRPGGVVGVRVYVLRQDGFDGEIEVTLKDAPEGFELTGGRIPAGCDGISMTLAVPEKAPDGPVAIKLQGAAKVGSTTITRQAVGAEDMMQAFLYRHLVPSQELLVSIVKSKFRVPPVSLARSGPVEIPAGGSTQVSVKTWKRQALNQIQLELRDPPEGVSLDNVKVVPEGLAFRLKADKDTMESGFEDNLIIEAFTQTVQKNTNQKRRTSIGLFPAIPIRIIQ